MSYHAITLNGALATPANFPDLVDSLYGSYCHEYRYDAASLTALLVSDLSRKAGAQISDIQDWSFPRQLLLPLDEHGSRVETSMSYIFDIIELEEPVLTHYTIEVNGDTDISKFHAKLSGKLVTTDWHNVESWLRWLFGDWRVMFETFVPNRAYTLGNDSFQILADDRPVSAADLPEAIRRVESRHERVSKKLADLEASVRTLINEVSSEYEIGGDPGRCADYLASERLRDEAMTTGSMHAECYQHQLPLVELLQGLRDELDELADTVTWMPSEFC